MASSLGLPSGARPCAASDSRGLIFAAQPVIRPMARAKSVKRKIVAVNVRMRFINLVITQSWMQQQFGTDSWFCGTGTPACAVGTGQVVFAAENLQRRCSG